jgi:hypothetical protein
MISVEDLRTYIAGLSGVAESTEAGLIRFAVAGEDFLWVEDSRSTAVATVDQDHAASVVNGQPDLYEEVWHGEARFVGIRIDLARAPEGQARALAQAAWRNKAPAEAQSR